MAENCSLLISMRALSRSFFLNAISVNMALAKPRSPCFLLPCGIMVVFGVGALPAPSWFKKLGALYVHKAIFRKRWKLPQRPRDAPGLVSAGLFFVFDGNGFSRPMGIGSVQPHAVHNHRNFAGRRHLCLFASRAFHQFGSPSLKPGTFLHPRQDGVGGLV